MTMLRGHDIAVTASHNTARAALASQLPASVLADLTGIHIHTAVAWNRVARGDRTEHVALLAEDASAGPRPRLDRITRDHSAPAP